MNEVCVDASMIVKLVIKGESHRVTARRFLQDCIINQVELIAPPLIESEADTALRRRAHDGRMTPEQAQRAFVGLDKVNVSLINQPGVRQRARQIAEQFHQPTVYDSTYAALAELRGCEFWTADKAFYDAVKDSLLFVKYLPEYP